MSHKNSSADPNLIISLISRNNIAFATKRSTKTMRTPGPLHIKIADFALAQNKPDMQTFCGTHIWMAPEQWQGDQCTSTVDTWALGIVIMGLLSILPLDDARRISGPEWCDFVLAKTAYEQIRPRRSLEQAMITVMDSFMVRLNPASRLSAKHLLGGRLDVIKKMVVNAINVNDEDDDKDAESDDTVTPVKALENGERHVASHQAERTVCS
ncbi:MAG: hypothetical protein Q9164_002592 [Protoblastenia rupestris]